MLKERYRHMMNQCVPGETLIQQAAGRSAGKKAPAALGADRCRCRFSLCPAGPAGAGGHGAGIPAGAV